MQKVCSRCGLEKSVDDFNRNKSRKDGLQGFCRTCQSDRQRSYYNENKDYYFKKSRKHLDKRYTEVSILKSQCIKCGETDEVCLDFHHVNPEEKLFEIASGIRAKSREIVAAEIAKCVVLCSNCHRKFHAGRFEL